MSTHTSRAVLLFVGFAVLVACSVAVASGRRPSGAITHKELTQVLDCLTRKGQPLGLAPSFANEQRYRLRYFYGVRDPSVDRQNELHLVVYGKDGRSALLYELLITGKLDCPHFEFINTASLKLRKGHWSVTETLGGVYTYKRIQQLVDFISTKRVIQVPADEVTRTCAECSYR